MKELVEQINTIINTDFLLKHYKKHLKEILKAKELMNRNEINAIYGEKIADMSKKEIKFAIDYIDLILKYGKMENENEK